MDVSKTSSKEKSMSHSFEKSENYSKNLEKFNLTVAQRDLSLTREQLESCSIKIRDKRLSQKVRNTLLTLTKPLIPKDQKTDEKAKQHKTVYMDPSCSEAQDEATPATLKFSYKETKKLIEKTQAILINASQSKPSFAEPKLNFLDKNQAIYLPAATRQSSKRQRSYDASTSDHLSRSTPPTLKKTPTDIPHNPIQILSTTFSQKVSKKISLPNGLQAYLVSDPALLESGISLTCRCGSIQDPTSFPGMAHCMEHMFFSCPHPEKQDNCRCIKHYANKYNGVTHPDYTHYCLTMPHESFNKIINNLIVLLSRPNLDANSLRQEIEVIEQEYQDALQDNGKRSLFAQRKLALNSHKYHHLSHGNRETLKSLTSQQLYQWFQRHYKPHKMQLIVYSKENLETLSNVIVKNFSQLRERACSYHCSEVETPVYPPEYRNHLCSIKSCNGLTTLSIKWQINEKKDFRPTQRDIFFLKYLFEGQGEGSLLAYLREKDLAEHIFFKEESNSSNSFFLEIIVLLNRNKNISGDQVSSTLTKQLIYKTLEHYAQNEIPQHIFKEFEYQRRIRHDWQRRKDLFESLKKEGELLFKEDFFSFSYLSCIPELSSYGDFVVSFQKLSQNLLSCESTLSLLQSPKSVGDCLDTDLVKSSLDMSPLIKSINEAPSCQNILSQLNVRYPRPNPFIPENLSILHPKDPEKNFPTLECLCKKGPNQCLYASDSHYLEPRAYLSLHFQILEKKITPSTELILELLSSLLLEKLAPIQDQAQRAGLTLKLHKTPKGFRFILTGWNDKALYLVENHLYPALYQAPFTREGFQSKKQELESSYQYDLDSSPCLEEALEFINTKIRGTPSKGEKLRYLEQNIGFEAFLDFYNLFSSQSCLEAVFYGNLEKKACKDCFKMICPKTILDTTPPVCFNKEVVIRNNAPSHLLILTCNHGPIHKHKCRMDPLQHPSNEFLHKLSSDYLKKISLDIWSHLVRNPLRDNLRKKGLVYSIQVEEVEENDQLFSRYRIPSSSHSPEALLAFLHQFLHTFLEQLDEKKELFDRYLRKIQQENIDPPEHLEHMGYLLLKQTKEAPFYKEVKKRALEGFSFDLFKDYCRSFVPSEDMDTLTVMLVKKEEDR